VSTTLTTGLFRGIAYGNGVFMIIAQGATGVNSLVWTSSDGSVWNPGTATIPGVSNLTFGNGFFIAGSSNNGDTAISRNTGTGSWTNITTSGMAGVNNVMFGAMSNGTNVFISTGSGVRRSIDNGSTWQNPTTGVANNLGIRACGFGNDVFMVSTFNVAGLMSISRDGANNWSTVGVFNLTLNMFLYVEKKWYVGTDSNIILISKDDGTTWTKVEGPKFSVCVYGNSIFAVAWTDQQSVIKFKTNRSDGSAITSDTITIGREGTNATIAADTLTMPGKVYVPPATLTSEGGLTFSTDQQLIPSTHEYEGLGQRSNKVRIQTFSLSIMDEPSSYSGKNIVSGFTHGQNTQSGSFNAGTGEYTYTSTAAALGNINPNFTATVGQTYKVVFTLKTTTTYTTVQIRDTNNGCWLDLGYIGTGYKTYVGYVRANTSNFLIGIYSAGGFVTPAAKTIVIKHFSLEALDSGNVLDVTGYVAISGNLGIGTTKSEYPLHVVPYNYTQNAGFTYVYFANGSNGIQPGTSSNIADISIFAEGNILTKKYFFAVSDRRIKTNIVDIDDDRALRDLRLLKPKTYTYTDVVQKGSTPVYGFIAQEVKEVLNYASSYMTDTVPNVYELATFSGDTLTLTLNTSDLSRDASGTLFPRLKIKTREEKDEFVNILEIIDEHTLRVDKDLTAWGGELVGEQIVPGNRIFVYGQEVLDFHTLNKDAIWTVATAALQEVDRQLQAEKQKTATMQTALDALLERVIALEQKTSV
jgi:hypothetical protein